MPPTVTAGQVRTSAAAPTTADPFDSEAVQIAAFTHASYLPPHGPFAYLSAATLSRQLRHGQPVAGQAVADSDDSVQTAAVSADASPQRCLDFFNGEWNIDHLRTWPTFYAAGEVRVADAAALAANPNGRKPGP